MLFNSYIFIFFFLPITYLGYRLLAQCCPWRVVLAWFVGCSLFFYAWWNVNYLALLLVSILVNYMLGRLMVGMPSVKKTLLVGGVVFNLGVLVFFKYANFTVNNVNLVFGTKIDIPAIVIPLAISFHTFQQLVYLCYVHQHGKEEKSLLHYTLFVSFFPQLIAGPIIHHDEILPQFAKGFPSMKEHEHNVMVGVSIFIIGLFKKVVMADGLAMAVDSIFNTAGMGTQIRFVEAWAGVLAYAFQIYFDFSGYSDMAIGLARMFNIVLPMNFNSPYKATSIIDFWRRWHMTLSRFLRDYLYIPLGGNRKGTARQYVNVMVTMILGGLWHGAGWGFLLWGTLHGVYLMINHAWRWILARGQLVFNGWMGCVAGVFTFTAVVIAWIPFRATSVDQARQLLLGMSGVNGISLPKSLVNNPICVKWASQGVIFNGLLNGSYAREKVLAVLLVSSFLICWFMPNVVELFVDEKVVLKPPVGIQRYSILGIPLKWQAIPMWFWVSGFLLLMSFMNLNRIQTFIYFQF